MNFRILNFTPEFKNNVYSTFKPLKMLSKYFWINHIQILDLIESNLSSQKNVESLSIKEKQNTKFVI